MKAFATLLDRLTYTPARNGKLTLMRNYFRTAHDPDRGFALAALTDGVPVSFPLRRIVSELSRTRFDAELFRLSRADVGDTAETLALIWPDDVKPGGELHPSDVVESLRTAPASSYAALLAGWLDRLDTTGRWALLKFLGGAPRVGVSARLAKQAVADAFGVGADDIEELWHGLEAPYLPLFAWLEGRAERPEETSSPIFRPLMLAHPLEDGDWETLSPDDFAAEWKWDGIRVQVAGRNGITRLFSRTGDDIGQSFPDLVSAFSFEAILDGELLVMRDGEVAPFSDLQQRLNRKSVTRSMLAKYPVHVRFYDVLEIAGEDLRGLPFTERRERLEAWHARHRPPRSDLSGLLDVADKDALRAMWEGTRSDGIEVDHLVVPYTLDTNDMRFATPQGFNTGDHFFQYLRDSFDVLYEEGAEHPKMMSIGMHCRLLGRPGRFRALQRFLDHIESHDRVWVGRRIDVARHWIQRHPAPAAR